MTSEEQAVARLHTIALMAAALAAGDRIAAATTNASTKNGYEEFDRGMTDNEIAAEAIRLYYAVEAHEHHDIEKSA